MSSAVPISPELQAWLQGCIAAGHDRATVRAALRSHGYDRNMAERICTHAFGVADAAARQPAQPARTPAFAPDQGDYSYWFEPAWPLVGGHDRNSIQADHGNIRILSRSERPYVVALGNVLSADECRELIEYARPRLKRAEVVGEAEGESVIDPRRTAEEAVIDLGETPLVARIDARIRELTGLPVSHGEGLQVMRYKVGAEYQPHFDFFDGASAGSRAPALRPARGDPGDVPQRRRGRWRNRVPGCRHRRGAADRTRRVFRLCRRPRPL